MTAHQTRIAGKNQRFTVDCSCGWNWLGQWVTAERAVEISNEHKAENRDDQ